MWVWDFMGFVQLMYVDDDLSVYDLAVDLILAFWFALL